MKHFTGGYSRLRFSASLNKFKLLVTHVDLIVRKILKKNMLNNVIQHSDRS